MTMISHIFHGSSDGSAFTNAFWMYVSRLDPLQGLLSQLAHESFHAWDPKRMGLVSSEADENSIKWFREGPTEYYAQLLTFKAGELSASDYVSSLNGDLRKFPVSNSEYVRGRIIALWLDATIRQESGGKHSLDDVMYDMVRGRSESLTLTRIFETSSRYLSASSLSTLRRAVNENADLPAPRRIPSVNFCAHPSTEDLVTFDLGLDLPHSTATGTLTGVIPGSPAYLAGLSFILYHACMAEGEQMDVKRTLQELEKLLLTNRARKTRRRCPLCWFRSSAIRKFGPSLFEGGDH